MTLIRKKLKKIDFSWTFASNLIVNSRRWALIRRLSVAREGTLSSREKTEEAPGSALFTAAVTIRCTWLAEAPRNCIRSDSPCHRDSSRRSPGFSEPCGSCDLYWSRGRWMPAPHFDFQGLWLCSKIHFTCWFCQRNRPFCVAWSGFISSSCTAPRFHLFAAVSCQAA